MGAGRGSLPARGSQGSRPLSGVSKERVTLWSGVLGADSPPTGFLGQSHKWDGATPSPSGEPTTTEAKRVVIVGYTGTSPVAHTRKRSNAQICVLRLSFPCVLFRVSFAANRTVLRLFGAFRVVSFGHSVPTVYEREIPGFVRYKHIRRWIMAVIIRSVG